MGHLKIHHPIDDQTKTLILVSIKFTRNVDFQHFFYLHSVLEQEVNSIFSRFKHISLNDKKHTFPSLGGTTWIYNVYDFAQMESAITTRFSIYNYNIDIM